MRDKLCWVHLEPNCWGRGIFAVTLLPALLCFNNNKKLQLKLVFITAILIKQSWFSPWYPGSVCYVEDVHCPARDLGRCWKVVFVVELSIGLESKPGWFSACDIHNSHVAFTFNNITYFDSIFPLLPASFMTPQSLRHPLKSSYLSVVCVCARVWYICVFIIARFYAWASTFSICHSESGL